MQRYIALQKIVESGSFSKAAEILGYTQSGISQMISSLEDEMSLRLLNRSRSVSYTHLRWSLLIGRGLAAPAFLAEARPPCGLRLWMIGLTLQ